MAPASELDCGEKADAGATPSDQDSGSVHEAPYPETPRLAAALS